MAVGGATLACATLVWIALVVPTTAGAVEPVTDIGELRRQITSGEIAADVPAGAFITARYDDYGWVSWQVAALKNDPPTTPLVVVVGGSAVRECLSDDAELADLINDKGDDDVRVVTLATMMQRLPSTLAIIDNLPRGSGVVIIGVHHPTFAATQDDAEKQLAGSPLLLTSAALRTQTVDEFGGDPPLNILPGLQTYLDAYERRRPRPPFTGIEMEYFRHRYDSKGALAVSTKENIVPRFSQGLGAPGGAFDTYFEFNVGLLERCVSLARDKGYQVLLMQDPMDTAVTGDAFAAYEARYDPEVKRIVKSEGAHYADLNTTTGLVDGDFFDLYHLLASGRAKWTPALGASVATILEDHPPEDQTAAAPHASGSTLQVAAAAAAASRSPSPKASKSPKGAKKKKAKDTAAGDDGGFPWWQTIVVLVVLIAGFLAIMRRRAVVKRRRRARARARARRRGGLGAVSAGATGPTGAADAGLAADPYAGRPSAFDAPPAVTPFSRDFTRPRDEGGADASGAAAGAGRPAGTAGANRHPDGAGTTGADRRPDTTGATGADRPPDTTGATAAFDWGPPETSEAETGAWTVLDPDD